MDCKYLRSLIITKVVFIKHSSGSKMRSINHIVFEVTTKAHEQLPINCFLMLQQILQDSMANIPNYRKFCFICFALSPIYTIVSDASICHNFRPQPRTLLVCRWSFSGPCGPIKLGCVGLQTVLKLSISLA